MLITPSVPAIMEGMFSTTTSSYITCTSDTCHGRNASKNPTPDKQWVFSLPMTNNKQSVPTLESCLKTYLNNKVQYYKCERCGDKSDKQRRIRLKNTPDILALHLNRASFGPRGPFKDKRNVRFDEDLDLSPYVQRSLKDENNNNNASLQYKLSSVVCHQGSSNFGHYISFVKGPTKQWFEIDDSDVTPVSFNFITSGKSGFTPYMFLYAR
jgi:ubiquitin C-terminal hydrolase